MERRKMHAYACNLGQKLPGIDTVSLKLPIFILVEVTSDAIRELEAL